MYTTLTLLLYWGEYCKSIWLSLCLLACLGLQGIVKFSATNFFGTINRPFAAKGQMVQNPTYWRDYSDWVCTAVMSNDVMNDLRG